MKVVGVVFGFLVLAAALAVVSTWWLMILLGNVHAGQLDFVPALGFVDTFWLMLLIGAVGTAFGVAGSASSRASS